MAEAEFSVYILRCADGSYYTGITTDVDRRVAEHEGSSRGAKYLKGRTPLTIVFRERVGDRSSASKAEYRVKQLQRRDKEALIGGFLSLQTLVAG